MAQPHYVTETQILQKVVSDPNCRWIWKNHALKRMAERHISQPDVESALTNGQVVLQEQKQDTLWRVKGKDIDGNNIEVVVAVYESAIAIKVVSTF